MLTASASKTARKPRRRRRTIRPPIVIDRNGAVVIPPEVATDPAKVEQALESARREIESIVSDQVKRSVAHEVRSYRERSGDWMMSFALLLILTGIIVKVVLGGKKRAERRAQVATATAAEEGLKRQLVEAQLKMMQAQVEPHFLFNTLASVDYLIETDPATASKMQKNLIQYLRAALPQMREGSTTLGKEVQLCRAYLEILKFRMEDRLHYTVTIPQGLMSAQFPPMMLQSLVENSIKHGLEPKPEGRRDHDLGRHRRWPPARHGRRLGTRLRGRIASRHAVSAWRTCASACRRCTADVPDSRSKPTIRPGPSSQSMCRTASRRTRRSRRLRSPPDA